MHVACIGTGPVEQAAKEQTLHRHITKDKDKVVILGPSDKAVRQAQQNPQGIAEPTKKSN